MAFEILVDANGDPIRPTGRDLAFFSSNDQDPMHGLGDLAGPHLRYWTGQEAAAFRRKEPIREQIARLIKSWLSLDGHTSKGMTVQFVQEAMAANPEITPQVIEGWRRQTIGALAMSMWLRSQGKPPQVNEIIMEPTEPSDTPDFILDLHREKNEREWPYEPRIHLELGDNQGIPSEAWFRQGRILVCTRPADMTPSVRKEMRGMEDRYFTCIPHLTAINSPLFAPGSA